MLIHDDPGYRLMADITHSRTGPTLTLTTVFPCARHPDPHRLAQLNLPPDSLQRLAALITDALAQDPAARRQEIQETIDAMKEPAAPKAYPLPNGLTPHKYAELISERDHHVGY
jgi:hypothetical protein